MTPKPYRTSIADVPLEQGLPVIALPLLPGDPDVMLDLQAVFNRAYDAGPYLREVDYGADPVVPRLRPDQARWAAACIKARCSPVLSRGCGRNNADRLR